MAGTDFSHLTTDELIKGIKALDLPDYIRSKAYGVDVRETLAQMTEMTIQLGVNMGLSPEDALLWARKLQESVSQSEFDSWVATLLDGGPSIFMNTLSELQTTYPNGAPGVALVRETDPAKIYVWNGTAWEDFGDYQGIEVKDNSITSSKFVNGAVNPKKTDFLKIGKVNGYNPNDKVLGTIESATGLDYTHPTYYRSDYIDMNFDEVADGETVIIKGTSIPETPLYFVYKNKGESGLRITDYVRTSENGYTVDTFNVPVGGYKYLRMVVSGGAGAYDTNLQILVNGSPNAEILRYHDLDDRYVKIGDDILGDDIVKPENIAGTTDNNLFIKSKVTDNFIFDKNAEGTLVASSGYAVTDYIPVIPQKTYTVASGRVSDLVALYDINKEYIGLIQGTPLGSPVAPYSFKILTPTVTFMRININKTNTPINSFGVVEGTDYTLKSKIDWLEIDDTNIKDHSISADKIIGYTGATSYKAGKKLVTFGNSRTWYDGQVYSESTSEPGVLVNGYQSYIRERLGMEVINMGVSGAKVRDTLTTIQNYDFDGSEYAISLMHGTNNFNEIASGTAGKSIGTTDFTMSGNYDLNTYAGELQTLVEWVSVNLPHMKFYIMSDAWGWKEGYGRMDEDYPRIMEEIANLYNYPYLDLYHNCGFNENNMTHYYVDILENVHFYFHENTKGFERISELIVPFIENH